MQHSEKRAPRRMHECRDSVPIPRPRRWWRGCQPVSCPGGRGSRLLDPRRSHAKTSDCGSQKSPVSPIPAKISRISSGPGRRAPGSSRVEYQACASCHSWSIVTDGRRGTPRFAHHASMSSSDRKKSIVLQVKTMSRHHCAAGTRQWNNQSDRSGPSGPTRRRNVALDCSQRDRTSPGARNAAGMPSASQAQLA